MLKRSLAGLFAALYLFAGTIGYAKAEIPPVPVNSIYVQDYAKVLSNETKQKINGIGLSLQKQTKAQVAVVTVKSLEEIPIEEYSLNILRTWGVGDKSLNNGVVMLIAVDDRQSRFEVGYGLEGALPDAKTGQIQDEYLLPYVKAGDYDSGILNSYLALSKVVADEYKVTLAGASPPVKPVVATEASFFENLQNLIFAAVIIVLIILDFMFFGGRFTFLLLALLRSRGGGGGGGGYGGGSGGGGGSSRRW